MTDPRSKYVCEHCFDRGCEICLPPSDPRPKWDLIWMNLASNIAKRSTCIVPDRSVGCVIVSEDNSQVLALGYNGSAKGDDNSCEYNPRHGNGIGNSRCTCIHAEMNALVKLDSTNPCKKKMYLTLSPCNLCYKLIINAGISEVVYLNEYKSGYGLDKLKQIGIKIRKYENN